MTDQRKIKILFLCTGNSCRSQMAEGWARTLKMDGLDAYSAGIETHGLNPLAVQVMKEAGVDISGQRSKLVTELKDVVFDYVVTVCDRAAASCPLFPGHATVVHHAFDDPPHLAKSAATAEEALAHYRRVRDEIRAYVETLPETLAKQPKPQESDPAMTDTPKINTVETTAGCLDARTAELIAMRKFSDSVHELPGTAGPPPSPACCGNTTTKNGKSCCG